MATLTETRAPLAQSPRRSGLRLFDPGGGGRNLEEVLRDAFESAGAVGSAACLVCGAVAHRCEDGRLECTSCHSSLD